MNYKHLRLLEGTLTMELNTEDTVLVSGFTQTPKGTPLHEAYKYIGVILLIDKKTSAIVKSDFGVISQLTNSFLQELIKGFRVTDSFEDLSLVMRESISLPSERAILQALKIDRKSVV